MTRATLRAAIKGNLNEANITDGYFDDNELNELIQDTYDFIVAVTGCYVKTSSALSWQSGLNYYDLVTLGITDYISVIGIFNNNTNRWLIDDTPVRAFDSIRTDWELWTGQPVYWAPHSLKYTVIVPSLTSATGTYTVTYRAKAPTLSSDSDTFVIAADMQKLLEFRCTGLALETAEESNKASVWFSDFYPALNSYKERIENLSKKDLMMRSAQSGVN